MYSDQTITNPNESTIQLSGQQYTSSAIRIDDSDVSVRKTWSSAKVSVYAAKSEEQINSEFLTKYGNLYFSDYDESQFTEWTPVVKDANRALNNGNAFYVAWTDKRPAQVISANLESEPRLTVLMDGRAFSMTDTGIREEPLYNVVLQYPTREDFPARGVQDRIYVDLHTKASYCWNDSIGYFTLTEPVTLHKLTFGADQAYVYDGTEDITVPVYMGETN